MQFEMLKKEHNKLQADLHAQVIVNSRSVAGTYNVCCSVISALAVEFYFLLCLCSSFQKNAYIRVCIHVSICVYQGCSPNKRSGGTPETRLRQRFLNNLGLHTRTLIHVRKIATADLWSCPAIQLLY